MRRSVIIPTGHTTSPEEVEEVALKTLRERNLLADHAEVRKVIVKNQETLVVVV